MAVTLTGMTLLTNNDNETWAGTDGPDTYNVSVQGTNSESWNVAKNGNETGTLTLSASLPAGRGLLMFWMKSDLQYYYTGIYAELESSANNFKNFTCTTSATQAISGDFKPSALDYVNKGTATGTYVPGSHTVLRINVDNSSSGNIRSVINNWIDAIYYGAGLVLAGTSATNEAFAEAAAIDQNGTNEYGILNNYNDIVFSQGDLTLDGTSLISIGETLVFIDTPNGYDRYNFTGTGTAALTNTTVKGSGAIDYDMDMSGMASFSMTGGGIIQCNQLTLAAGQTLDGVVLTNVNASSISTSPSSCVWNQSGTVTVTGSLTSCTFNETTATTAVITSALSNLSGCDFTSDGSSHAVELTSIGAGSMTWDSTASGYDAGATGSPVTATSTGNEALYVNVASGTLTVNVASGATTPSIRSAGAVINVVAGLSTLAFTVDPSITGYEWRIYTVTAKGSLSGAVEVAGEESAAADNQSYSYTYSAGVFYAIQFIPHAKVYEEQTTYYDSSPNDQNILLNLETDDNN